MKYFVVIAVLVLLGQAAIRDDLMDKVPVLASLFRVTGMILRVLYIRAISTRLTLRASSITSSWSPSKDLITKIRSPSG